MATGGYNLPTWASSLIFVVCLVVMPTRVAALGAESILVWLGFAGLLALSLGGIFYMWYVNRYGKPRQKGEKRHSKPVEYFLLFMEHIFLELIGLIYTIIGIVSMESNDWTPLDMTSTKIAFYVFCVLKYVAIGLSLWFELKDDNLRLRIAYFLHIRPDWPEILDAIIFIPTCMIDGLLMNAEYRTQSLVQDIFPFDSVILFCLDSFLYMKFLLFFILRVWTEDGQYRYDIKNIVFSCISFFYTILMCWLFVVAHLNSIFYSGMDLTVYMNICIVAAFTHLYMSSYSSMIAQNILLLDKVLRESEHRIDQIQVFIRYFQYTPFWIFINLCFYGYTLFIYIYIWIITQHLASNLGEDEFINTSIRVMLIVVNIFNFFFLANWIFAVLKRLGTCVGLRAPFDCSEYAKATNQILAGCRCGFVMDSAMQCRSR